ncbi:MAG: FAD-dependent oxidoreductase [Chthoniobacterales bacterium]
MNAQDPPRKPRDLDDPYFQSERIFPELSDAQVQKLASHGIVEDLPAGTSVFKRGDRTADFFLILKGCVEIIQHRRAGDEVITVHGKNQFTGELDLFNTRKILVSGRIGPESGKVLRLKRNEFRQMLASEPEIGEIIMRAFILRRMGLVVHRQGGVTLVHRGNTPDKIRIERFLTRNRYPLETVDYDAAPDSACIISNRLSESQLPAVVLENLDKVLVNPSVHDLADELGLVEDLDCGVIYDVVIVGAGPAGLSAAVYAASEGLRTLVLEGEAPGGQAATSSKIENFLGFPTGTSGQALADSAQVQAQKFGATIALPFAVEGIDCDQRPFVLKLCGGHAVRATTVIIASGAHYRSLDVDNSKRFINAGLHYAATVMEAALCADEEVIVVGGGNSAGQAAVFLAGRTKGVHLLVRKTGLASTMSQYLEGRIRSSDRITLHPETEITQLHGDNRLEGITWRDNSVGETKRLPIRNVFLMIGAQPNSEWLGSCVATDSRGFVHTGADIPTDDASEERRSKMLETSVPGIFAAGDVRSGSTKRVAAAIGEGGIAVSHVHDVLGTYL